MARAPAPQRRSAIPRSASIRRPTGSIIIGRGSIRRRGDGSCSRTRSGMAGGSILYAYVQNDPLNNTDPTGLFLWPWETPVAVAGGTAAQRADYQSAAAAVLSTPRGQQLEQQIIGPWYWHGSPQTIQITPGVSCGACVNFYKYPDGTLTSTNTVLVDPSYHPELQTTAGPQAASDVRILAHELGHSVTGTQDSGPGQMDNINQNENPIVKALGLPERTQYGSPSGGASPTGETRYDSSGAQASPK